jgi:hypothetical protein
MGPLIAIAAISALSQAYNSERARGANKDRLREIQKAFDAIVPPDYDISINDPPAIIKETLKGAELDFSRITPETYKTIGTYAPESAKFVAEEQPKLVQGTAAQKEGRAAQIEALRNMQSIAKGDSPELKIRMQQAADQAQAQAQSRSQSTMQDAQRRGQMGSGLSFASMLQGSSDAMQGGAAASQDAAIAAYKDKLAAMQSSGQMGRQLSQDELSQEGANNDITNQFNQRTSRDYQNYLQQRAQTANQAQQFNLGREQDTANRNVGVANQAQQFNLENRNRLAQQSYENTRGERNYQNDLSYRQAQWNAAEKARQNQLKQQSYSDQMGRASGRAGLGYQQMAQNTQNAQDYNQMIGGVASAGMGAYQQQQQDDRWDKYNKSRWGED